MLFSACGPNLFQTQAEERPSVVHADVDFSTLEYTRPDLDALNAKIDTALEPVSYPHLDVYKRQARRSAD